MRVPAEHANERVMADVASERRRPCVIDCPPSALPRRSAGDPFFVPLNVLGQLPHASGPEKAGAQSTISRLNARELHWRHQGLGKIRQNPPVLIRDEREYRPFTENRRWPGGCLKNTRREGACNGWVKECGRDRAAVREIGVTVVQNRPANHLNRRVNSQCPAAVQRYQCYRREKNIGCVRLMSEMHNSQPPAAAFPTSICARVAFSARKIRVTLGPGTRENRRCAIRWAIRNTT